MIRAAKLLALAGLLAASASCLAVTVTGKWTGKLAVKFVPPAKLKPAPTPEQIKQVDTALNSITIDLSISANGTYTATTRSGGKPQGPSKGKWKLKGKTLTLTPDDKRPPEIGTVAANGKSITFAVPKDMADKGVSGRAVFKRV